MRLRLALALTMMTASGVAAEVTKLEAPGSVAPNADPGCVTMIAADPRLSPPDLALGILACGRAGNWDAAAELYVLMLLRSDFDVRRVADPSAHQAGEVLTMQLNDTQSEADRASLGDAIQRVADPDVTQREILCRKLRTSGVPQHDPSWMIQHGMAAFTGLQGDGLVPGIDPAALWEQVMQETVACG
jgi:pentatricopeptide repeat protein